MPRIQPRNEKAKYKVKKYSFTRENYILPKDYIDEIKSQLKALKKLVKDKKELIKQKNIPLELSVIDNYCEIKIKILNIKKKLDSVQNPIYFFI